MPKHQMTSFPKDLGLSHRQHHEIFLFNQRKGQEPGGGKLGTDTQIQGLANWNEPCGLPMLQHSNPSTLYIDSPSFTAFQGTHHSSDLIRQPMHHYYSRSTSRPRSLVRPLNARNLKILQTRIGATSAARSRERAFVKLPSTPPRGVLL